MKIKIDFRYSVLVFLLLLSRAQGAERLPALVRGGIIPVQWEGFTPADSNLIEQKFIESVRRTKRFLFLKDELVKTLWEEESGREELEEDFEVDVFISMQVAYSPDTVQWVIRLLDPKLVNFVVESETFSRSEYQRMDPVEVERELDRVVGMTMNRIPVDIVVTSVQGKYLTVSGGRNKGLANGDTLDIIRVFVTSKHPATGAWAKFEKKTLGSATVVDVKGSNAIVMLDDLNFEGSVELGDGAHVKTAYSRLLFADGSNVHGEEIEEQRKSIIITPMAELSAEPVEEEARSKAPETRVTRNLDSMPEVRKPDPVLKKESPPPARVVESESSESFLDFGWPNSVAVDNLVESVRIEAGYHNYSVSGPVSSSNNFPLWLVNDFSAHLERSLFLKLKTDLGGGVGFGSFGSNSYTSYFGIAKVFWQDEFDPGSALGTWRAGVFGKLEGLGVGSGRFGGGDFLSAGITGGVGGEIFKGQDGFNWFFDLGLIPMAIGRVGYAGSRRGIESSSGLQAELTVLQNTVNNSEELIMGGGVSLLDRSFLMNNSDKIKISEVQLKFIARLNL